MRKRAGQTFILNTERGWPRRISQPFTRLGCRFTSRGGALPADLRALLPPIWPEVLRDRPVAALWPLMHPASRVDQGLRS
ncbi:hypothetical protein CO251_00650 [Sulfobacillus sp. hq2]|nr:hypothetical protein CO251_00650 [Sulfobacillus sp. hq2]